MEISTQNVVILEIIAKTLAQLENRLVTEHYEIFGGFGGYELNEINMDPKAPFLLKGTWYSNGVAYHSESSGLSISGEIFIGHDGWISKTILNVQGRPIETNDVPERRYNVLTEENNY